MSSEKNQYGLSKHRPSSVEEEIRQRCGFGCVICGLCFYDYEHFNPDFKDARIHDPRGMTLLCMQCNQKRNRGLLSREAVARHNITPKCLEQGFAREWLDYGSEPILTKIRTCSSTPGDIIRVGNESLLSVQQPTSIGKPWRLSAKFVDDQNNPTLEINENVLTVHSSTWDVTVRKSSIIVRPERRKRTLILTMHPPKELVIEQLDMSFEGWKFEANNKRFRYKKLASNNDWITLADVHNESKYGRGFLFLPPANLT
jgi:hypothetical protein